MLFLLPIAFRNLFRNSRRSFFTLGSLVVGLTIMTALRGYVNAVQTAQIDSVTQGFTGFLKVTKKGYMKNILSNPLTLNFEDSKELREKILAVPHVKGLAPRISVSGLCSTPETPNKAGKSNFLSATGIEPESEKNVSPKFWEWISEGKMLSENEDLVLNQDIAKGLDIKLSDTTSDSATWPAFLGSDIDGAFNGELVRPVGFLISAIPGDKRTALMSLPLAQKILRLPGKITEYTLSVTNVEFVQEVKKNLQSTLSDEFEVSAWDEILPFMKDLQSNIDYIFGIISLVFLTIVGLGVVNTLFMNVLERTREIGTLLAIGFKKSHILFLFIFEGSCVGLIGGILGLTVGVLVVTVLHTTGISISAPGSTLAMVLRPEVSVMYLFKTLISTVIGCMVLSVLPAFKASSLNPIEALQSI